MPSVKIYRAFLSFILFLTTLSLIPQVIPANQNKSVDSEQNKNTFLVINYEKAADSYKKLLNKQLGFLKNNGYTAIGLGDLADLYKHKKSLPEKTVLILFSGGQRTTFEIVDPLLKKYNLKAMMFLNIKEMRRSNHYYVSWHTVQNALKTKRWDFGIAIRKNDDISKLKEAFYSKTKVNNCSAMIVDSGMDAEMIEQEFMMSFFIKSTDGINEVGGEPHNLSILNINPHWQFGEFKENVADALVKHLAKESLIKGDELYRDGLFKEALLEFQKAIEIYPKDARPLKYIGWCYWKLGQLDKTIQVWERLYSDNPNDVIVVNMLAKAYLSFNNLDKALELYKNSIEIDPNQDEVEFNISQIASLKGEFIKSIPHLYKLLFDNPKDKGIRFRLARDLFALKRFSQAAEHFKIILEESPDNIQYKVGLAKSLYWSQEYEESLKLFNEILEKEPQNPIALELLADDAIYLNNYKKAIGFLNKIIISQPEDIRALNKLARINFQLKKYKEAIKFLLRSLLLDEAQIDQISLLADCLRLNKQFDSAKLYYEKALKLNPNNLTAINGLKELFLDFKNQKQALEMLNKAGQLDPANIYREIEKAKIFAYQKKYQEAIDILNKLRSKIKDKKSVLVLLYHGLSDRQRDDILKVNEFRQHLEVLKDLSFTSITPQDLYLAWQGEKGLPQNPVLITFDDARRDSFNLADPILEELGFKAVMFVPVSYIREGDPLFCSWDELRSFENNGRWSLQSHGLIAHKNIKAGQDRDSLFLNNLIWLDEENRFENEEEFLKRLDSDYEQSKNILESLLENEVVAYAYPLGSFGQEKYSNYPNAVSENLESISKYYKLAFTQDKYGFNLVGDNLYILKRFEPPLGWDGKKFKNHILSNNPLLIAGLTLANVLRWAGYKKQALDLYNQLLKDNPDAQLLQMSLGSLFMETKDYRRAGDLFEHILDFNPDDEATILKINEIQEKIRSSLNSQFYNFSDNKERTVFSIKEEFSKPLSKNINFSGSFLRGRSKEDDLEVYDNEYSLSLEHSSGLNNYLLSYIYKDFFDAKDANSYLFQFRTLQNLIDEIIFTNSYESLETAKAIKTDTKFLRNALSLRKNIIADTQLYLKYNYNKYNDTNNRDTFTFRLLKITIKEPQIDLGYEFIFDDAKLSSPNYYSPQKLNINQLIFQISDTLLKDKVYLGFSLRVGYATEDGFDDRIIQSFENSLKYTPTKNTEYSISFDLSRTPSYRSRRLWVGFKYKF